MIFVEQGSLVIFNTIQSSNPLLFQLLNFIHQLINPIIMLIELVLVMNFLHLQPLVENFILLFQFLVVDICGDVGLLQPLDDGRCPFALPLLYIQILVLFKLTCIILFIYLRGFALFLALFQGRYPLLQLFLEFSYLLFDYFCFFFFRI